MKRQHLTLVKDPGSVEKPLMGLRVGVFRQTDTDFSRGGISARHKEVVIVGPGVPRIVPVTPATPAVAVETIQNGEEVTYHVRPADNPDKHYMDGGTFVYSPDSRFRRLFPFYGAVALHDRHEG